MATEPLFDLKDSWSSAGTVFTGIQLNVTDAASAADSKLLDLQVGGESKFIIYKDGRALIAAALELGVDLAILHGGTGASTAAGARTNLGLAIGTNVQAQNAVLQAYANIASPQANRIAYLTGADTAAYASLTPFARSILDDADAATVRATIALNNVANKTEAQMVASGAIADALAARLLLTGGTLTGSLTMAAAANIIMASSSIAWTRGAQARHLTFDGTWFGILGNDGNWDMRVNDAGQLWTAELGDLNARIEARAAAYAAERVANGGSGPVGALYFSGNNIAFPVMTRQSDGFARVLAHIVDRVGHWGVVNPNSGGSMAMASGQALDFLWNGSQIFYRLDGNAYVAFGTGPSDERLKEVHGPADGALERILDLSPVEFTFKPNEFLSTPEGQRRGFLAQDLERHYPAAVIDQSFPGADEDHPATFKGLSQDAPMQIIADLVASIQTLTARIATLEAAAA